MVGQEPMKGGMVWAHPALVVAAAPGVGARAAQEAVVGVGLYLSWLVRVPLTAPSLLRGEREEQLPTAAAPVEPGGPPVQVEDSQVRQGVTVEMEPLEGQRPTGYRCF